MGYALNLPEHPSGVSNPKRVPNRVGKSGWYVSGHKSHLNDVRDHDSKLLFSAQPRPSLIS